MAVDRQSHYLEKYDPGHPTAVAAENRIIVLSDERKLAEGQLSVLRARPQLKPLRSNEIEAILAAIPDLRPALDSYSPQEFRELLEAFAITITVDKPAGTMTIAASLISGQTAMTQVRGWRRYSESVPWS